MKVLVVSEGKHEQSGALENLLKKLGGKDHHFDHDKIANKNLPRIHGGKEYRKNEYCKKAIRWLLEAQNTRVMMH